MKTIGTLIALTVLLLVGCVQQSTNSAGSVAPTDTTTEQGDKLHIKDPLQYSQSFIDAVRNERLGDVELYDSTMVVGKDTAIFPTILKAGKMYYFKGRQGSNTFALTIIRASYSSVDYDFSLIEKGITKYLNKGQADISPRFYLASENDEDDEAGESYGAAKYIKTEGGCIFTIRIGLDKDEKGRLRAKISHVCDDESKTDPLLANSPVLRTELLTN